MGAVKRPLCANGVGHLKGGNAAEAPNGPAHHGSHDKAMSVTIAARGEAWNVRWFSPDFVPLAPSSPVRHGVGHLNFPPSPRATTPRSLSSRWHREALFVTAMGFLLQSRWSSSKPLPQEIGHNSAPSDASPTNSIFCRARSLRRRRWPRLSAELAAGALPPSIGDQRHAVRDVCSFAIVSW